MERLLSTIATIVAFFSIEQRVSRILMLAFGFILTMSMFMNVVMLFEPAPEPFEPYKMYDLDYASKETYVIALSHLFAYYEYHDSEYKWTMIPRLLAEMDVYTIACDMITPEMEINDMKRLMFLVTRINENGCEADRGMD